MSHTHLRRGIPAGLLLGLGLLAWLWPSLRGLLAPLLVGWLRFGQASLVEAHIAWGRVAEFGLSLLLVAIGLQAFVKGVWGRPWPLRRSLIPVAGLLLLFVIGVASHGLARQLWWLGQGPVILPAGGP